MVKLKDIAERTGVTISTVSAALNGRGNLNPETRERLIETARLMGYAPNQAARQLRNKPAVDVALVIHDDFLRLSSTYLVHISEFLKCCRKYDLSQRIEFFTMPDKENEVPEVIRDGVARGIIYIGFIPPGLRAFQKKHPEYPLVTFGEPSRFCVRSAIDDGAYLAVKHLAELGVRRLLVSGGPVRYDYHRLIQSGAERAVRDFGLIPVAQEFRKEIQPDEAEGPFFSATVGWAKRVLACEPRPEAVFCSGSFPGRALLLAALERGIKIPDELKVITVGIINAGSGSYPELTSLEHRYGTMMDHAFHILEQIWNGKAKNEIELKIKPELVVTTSTIGESSYSPPM